LVVERNAILCSLKFNILKTFSYLKLSVNPAIGDSGLCNEYNLSLTIASFCDTHWMLKVYLFIYLFIYLSVYYGCTKGTLWHLQKSLWFKSVSILPGQSLLPVMFCLVLLHQVLTPVCLCMGLHWLGIAESPHTCTFQTFSLVHGIRCWWILITLNIITIQ
jgi:hypothetical protein